VQARLLLFALGGVLFLTGCSSELDAGKLAASAKDFAERVSGMQVKSASCPSGIKPEQGRTFECQAQTTAGQRLVVVVQQLDSEGKTRFTALR
jgi:hypothetical protein